MNDDDITYVRLNYSHHQEMNDDDITYVQVYEKNYEIMWSRKLRKSDYSLFIFLAPQNFSNCQNN